MIHMKVGLAIVHELRSSCQVDHGQVSTPSGVIAAGCGVPSMRIVTYITPLDCRTGTSWSAARLASGMSAEAASVAGLDHHVVDVIDNSVDAARLGAFPSGGTGSKIVARRAGATGGIGARRALSTGRLGQGRRVDDFSRVSAAEGGVRFGVYTGPMTTQTISFLAASTALVGPVGR